MADTKWLLKGKHHTKLIDGFTFTMPDTPKNQAVYPQQKAQAPGVGLPIARAVAITSLATACVMELAVGPYKGKQTGEAALLRSILSALADGDIAYDHLIVWTRPERPPWMDAETYAQIPQTLTLRELRFNVVAPGRRTRTIDIITTLIDANEYTSEDIASLYGFRWNSELDIRSIKSNLNLEHVRCKSSEMVRRELWTTLLAYNLIRCTAAGAALLHDKQPRQISFTSTCQYVLASWMTLSLSPMTRERLDDYVKKVLKQISRCEVANRPGRLEPRVVKRRPKPYHLMQQPRSELRRQLRKRCT
ncbi:MAG: transposase [Planctomycetales bacterium]|nr:transposase [Planctomycetales bacterium]